ncbi:MAG: rhodanese-like domain-containing protein [Pseudomonadota bacterium]
MPDYPFANLDAQLNPALLIDKAALQANCTSGEFIVLDARSEARFLGLAPEPRPGLPSGHMPHSRSLPYDSLLKNGALKPAQELREMLAEMRLSQDSRVVTSCGSGVTAAVIALALVEAGWPMPALYDGAWAEWASASDTQLLTEQD